MTLIIFDCDGVLVSSEENDRDADLEFFARHNLFFASKEEYSARSSGLAKADFFQFLEAEYYKAHQCGLPPDFLPAMGAHHVARSAFAKAIEGVEAFVQAVADAGYPRAVATNGGPVTTRQKLRVAGLLPLLDPHIFSANHVPRPKPFPDLPLHVAKTMGFAPADCIFIEDSVPGATAGVTAGMHVIGFCGGGHRPPDYADTMKAAGVAETVNSMGELLALLAPRLGLQPRQAAPLPVPQPPPAP